MGEIQAFLLYTVFKNGRYLISLKLYQKFFMHIKNSNLWSDVSILASFLPSSLHSSALIAIDVWKLPFRTFLPPQNPIMFDHERTQVRWERGKRIRSHSSGSIRPHRDSSRQEVLQVFGPISWESVCSGLQSVELFPNAQFP